jgi:arginine repressor
MAIRSDIDRKKYSVSHTTVSITIQDIGIVKVRLSVLHRFSLAS